MPVTTRPPTPGSAMNNGATILGSIDARDRRYILASFHNNYVTWVLHDDGSASWGTYFSHDELREAVADLYERASRYVA
jgi:ketosteroid isomerase-like protein